MSSIQPSAQSGAVAAAHALLAQIEADAEALTALRRQTEARTLSRLRAEAALEALAPALPRAEADAALARLSAARREADALALRRASTAHAGLVELLAAWDKPLISVAEAQGTLEAQGLVQTRAYASGALKALCARGYVAKAARGLYRINRMHPDMVGLRLSALERELASGFEEK